MKLTQTPSCRAADGYFDEPLFAPRLTAMLAAVLLCGLMPVRVAGAGTPTVVGAETSVPISSSVNWNELVNIHPGSNQIVTLNPPLFSWFYAPGSPLNQAVDQNVYFFQFQADYDGTFANPVVNVRTPSCCYNFLAPFTSSPVHWRVAYINATNGATNSWITNTFTIAANATNWDRSMLADPNYLAAKGAHPHLLFNSANIASVYQFIQTNNTDYFQETSNLAVLGLSSPYWTSPAPWGNNAYTLNPDITSRALQISSAAFMWQMTGNPSWTNNLVTNFDNLVNCFVASGTNGGASGYDIDYGNSGGDNSWVKSISFSYDWLYSLLSQSERTNALGALDRVIRLALYNEFWVTPANPGISVYPGGRVDATSVYPPPYQVPYGLTSKLGVSHAWLSFAQTWIAALACYGDGYTNSAWPVFPSTYPSDAALYLDLGMNYMLGRGAPMGLEASDSGRSYGLEYILNNTWLYDMMNASMIFPEAKLNTNPRLIPMANWWIAMVPAGYESVHEQWGDVIFAGSGIMRLPSVGRDLALFSGSPAASLYFQSINKIYGVPGLSIGYDEMVPPYYFPMPPPQAGANAGYLPDEGWAWGSTYSPSAVNSFTNGVGFVFAARPRGSDGGSAHAEFNDLNIEIWAYGANVTDGQGGSDLASKLSWSYNTVQVNGMGQIQSAEGPITPVVASIIAFTNAPDYVYCVGDATYAYPHTIFPFEGDPGGQLIPPPYSTPLTSGPLNFITKVQRHVLFEHRQYFVIYDDLATATNASFEWVYHVFQDTITNLTTGGSFNYSISPADVSGHLQPFAWSNVNVYVYQVVNPMLLSAQQMHGTNAYGNPVTGENYYADAIRDLTNGTATPPMTNSIWVTNLVPTNHFHFMTVIYPVAPGAAPPTITRLDDYTVAVTNGAQGDVISFNPQTTNAYNFLVNSPYIASATTPLPTPPTPLFTNSGASQQETVTVVVPPPPALSPPPNLRILATLVPSTFTPVPGYYAWWNTDTLSGVNGSSVSSWTDSSASHFTASQSVPANQPTLELQVQNGRNAVWFNGLSDFLTSSAIPNVNQPVEIFCVVQAANLSFNGMVVGSAAGDPFGVGVLNDAYFLLAGDGLTGGTETNAWLEITAVVNDASSQLFINGVQVIAPGTRAGGDTMNGVSLGAMFAGSECRFWQGYIGDVIIYKSILSDANRQAIENGLRAKYGF